jgi:hypothetical protein
MPLPSHALSATVNFVALVLVCLYPVSGSVRRVRPLAEIDAASNTGGGFEYDPVRTVYPISARLSYGLNRLLDSAYMIGKL